MFISNVRSVVTWVLSGIKISMIILDEFVDFFKVIRIKMITFYAKLSLNRFGKELHFVSVSLGNFVPVVFLILCQDSLQFVSRLIEVQNFSQLTSDSTPYCIRGVTFIPHHHIINCHSETTLAMAPKLCDCLFLPFCHNLRKF